MVKLPHRLRQHEALVAAGPRREIERREVEHLREHHGDDHEGDAAGPERQRPDHQRQHGARRQPGQEAGGDAEAEVLDGEAGAVKPGGEEHRMAEAQKTGIAEQDVVAHGEDRQHHHAGEHQVVVVGQHELQCKEQRHDGPMQRPDGQRVAAPHRDARPEQPLRPEHQHQRHQKRGDDLGQGGREEDRDDAVGSCRSARPPPPCR